ncbi:MAG TPA: hypothetical protein VFS52_20770, partial [Steroidobacteraceae bacterium]|nr:hypothetical protein [Steroidobacteraceae bacterium]
MNAPLRRRRPPSCEACDDLRVIESRKLGRVRCPYCTVRKPPRTDWRPISAAERRRREQAELARTVVVADFKFPGVPTHLVSTDRVLLRWGAEGSGMPSEDPDAYRESLPVPLDPA